MRTLVWPFVSFIILSCSPMDKAVAVHNTAPVVTFEEPIEGETFEMNDAMIPKSWSQLATDIMVSKYFFN